MTSGASGEVMLAQDEGCPSKVGFLNNILLSYTDIYIYIYIYLCNEINDMYIYIIYYSGKYHILQETTFTRTTFVLARALYTYIYIYTYNNNNNNNSNSNKLGKPGVASEGAQSWEIASYSRSPGKRARMGGTSGEWGDVQAWKRHPRFSRGLPMTQQ